MQTGLTGIGTIWSTALVVSLPLTVGSAGSATQTCFSGVGKVVKMVKVGAEGVAQAEIELFPQGAHAYI